MRCLWITRQDPFPANSGELIYTSGLARALVEAGAEVTMVGHAAPTSARSAKQPPPERLRVITAGTLPERNLRNFLSQLPSDADRLRTESMVGEIRRQLAAGNFDVVVVDHAALGWAVDIVQQSGAKVRLVYVSHNCEFVIRKHIAEHCGGGWLKRTLMHRDARKYARLERRLCEAADLITAITPKDRRTYEHHFPRKLVIDLMPGYGSPAVSQRREPIGKQVPRRVLMIGSFEWIAKRYNLEETLSVADPVFVREGIELQVVGKSLPGYAEQIERRFDCVRFHPNVPDITPYLDSARLGLVCEAFGGGFKLKTLDYAFHQLPIAALEHALSGLTLVAGQDAIIEPSLPELIASIAKRIDDFEFLNRAASRTLDKLANQFHWPDRGTAMVEAIRSLEARDRGSTSAASTCVG